MVRRGAGSTAPTASDYNTDEDEDVLTEDSEDTTDTRSSSLQGGWAAAKKMISENSKGFTPEFKFSEDRRLVAFRNGGEPIASFKQHWLDGKSGRKSYACLASLKDENGKAKKCPLCSILGHQPDSRVAFDIITIGEDGVQAELLVVGPRLSGSLETYHDDPKMGPLSKGYWALSRTGKGSKTQHQINAVKERDLPDDWDVDPAEVKAQMAKIPALTADVIRFDTPQELTEIANELA